MEVILNEKAIAIPQDLSTWGDVLDWLETGYLKAGQCITRVVMDGNEESNYRNMLICEQDVATVGKINIESGDFDSVVRESLQELQTALAGALTTGQEVVALFEKRQEEQAYNLLASLLDSIRVFYTVFSEDLGWYEAPDAEISREEFSAALERALTQLISAQENRFWVSICDVLEYEIAPILESWLRLVERTRGHIN